MSLILETMSCIMIMYLMITVICSFWQRIQQRKPLRIWLFVWMWQPGMYLLSLTWEIYLQTIKPPSMIRIMMSWTGHIWIPSSGWGIMKFSWVAGKPVQSWRLKIFTVHLKLIIWWGNKASGRTVLMKHCCWIKQTALHHKLDSIP